MRKANWWRPKTHQLQWSHSSSAHSEGLHFCHFSTTLVSTFNWCNSRRFHLPVGIGWYLLLNYQYFSLACSAYICLACYPRAPFHSMFCCLMLAGGFICHSNILKIFTLKWYSLRYTDMFQTSTGLRGSFFVWKQKVFLICQFLSDSENSDFRWVRKSQKPGHATVLFAVKPL